jgi:hypothetical protein
MRLKLTLLGFLLQTFFLSAQPGSPFLQLHGTPVANESGCGVYDAQDGNFYVTGLSNGKGMIMKVAPDGTELWNYVFDIFTDRDENIAEIIVDEEGMLGGCGTFGEIPNTGLGAVGFVFRMNPNTQQIMWLHTGAFESIGNGILEDTQNDTYLFYSNPHESGLGDDASISFFERASGTKISQKRYDLGSSDNFGSIVMHQGAMYTVGRFTNGVGFEFMRQSISKLDMQGNAQWTFMSPVSLGADARLYGYDLVVNTEGITSTFSGDDNGTSTLLTDIFLQRTNLNGDIEWTKKYKLAGIASPTAYELVRVPDGFVVFGRNKVIQGSLFLMKTDLDGNPQWARTLRYGNNDAFNESGAIQSQLLSHGGFLWLTGFSTDSVGQTDLLLAKLDMNGQISGDCNFLSDLVVTATAVQNPVSSPVSITTSPFTELYLNSTVFPGTDQLTVNSACRLQLSQPDAVVLLKDLLCVNGVLQLQYNVSNLGDTLLLPGYPISLYDADPTAGAANLLVTFNAENDTLQPGFDETFNVPNSSFLAGYAAGDTVTLYAVINDNGALPTPFALNDLAAVGLPETLYDDNLHAETYVFPFCKPTLPDAVVLLKDIVCKNGELVLQYNISNLGDTILPTGFPVSIYDANPFNDPANLLVAFPAGNTPLAPGFDTTLVVPDNSFLAAYPSGSTVTLFAVINTDGSLPTPFTVADLEANGLPETLYTDNLDSVAYTLLASQLLDLGPDVILCTDSTVVLNAGTGFVSYLWQDGSSNPTFATDTAGLFFVQVVDSCGIAQFDSVFIGYSLLPDTRFPDTVVCQGSSIMLSLPGFDDYNWSPSAGLSCTDCSDITISPSTTTIYSVAATSTFGCVLFDTFTVSVLPLPTRNDTFGICEGDTLVLNGNVYTKAGVYVDTLTASTGCDTIATYVLKLLNDFNSIAVLSCPPNVTVNAAQGATSAIVTFPLPVCSTDCPCPDITMIQTVGPPSGTPFPLGNTAICFEAEDACGDKAACCFVVQVLATNPPLPPDDPCDIKNIGCLRYELLKITKDVKGDKTYQIRVTNFCASPLIYTAIQIPDGVVALAPANNSTYTSPSGRTFVVRNPNFTPMYSIRFKSNGNGPTNGQSDVFVYTLPEQSSPAYINITSRLSPSVWVEAHLNTFNCPVTAAKPAPNDIIPQDGNGLTIYPNPSSGELTAEWVGMDDDAPLSIRLFNAQGQLVWQQTGSMNGGRMNINLDGGLQSGVYQLVLQAADGRVERVSLVLRQD